MITGNMPETVAIRTGYFPSGEPLELPLKSSATGMDTIVLVDNYHPLVKPLLEVRRPLGYVLPAHDMKLMEWLELHQIQYENDLPSGVSVYACETIEGSQPPYAVKHALSINQQEYIYVPVNQLHGNFLVLTLEPLSELSIARLPMFSYLLDGYTMYPIHRVD